MPLHQSAAPSHAHPEVRCPREGRQVRCSRPNPRPGAGAAVTGHNYPRSPPSKPPGGSSRKGTSRGDGHRDHVRRHRRRPHRDRRALAAARRRALTQRCRGALVAAEPAGARGRRRRGPAREAAPLGAPVARAARPVLGRGGQRGPRVRRDHPRRRRPAAHARHRGRSSRPQARGRGRHGRQRARAARSPPPPATPARIRSTTPARSHALIDAVPEHILAASAPERDHDAGSWARALDSSPRSAVTDDPLGGAPRGVRARPRGTARVRAGATAARRLPTTTARPPTARPPTPPPARRRRGRSHRPEPHTDPAPADERDGASRALPGRTPDAGLHPRLPGLPPAGRRPGPSTGGAAATRRAHPADR